MRLLLDTHVIIWEWGGSRTIGPKAEELLGTATELMFSVVSFAEIGIKAATGKLDVPPDLRDRLANGGVRVLGLAPEHGLALAHLPRHHGDPFDRLLIAQAQSEGLTLMSADQSLTHYDVPTIDARV